MLLDILFNNVLLIIIMNLAQYNINFQSSWTNRKTEKYGNQQQANRICNATKSVKPSDSNQLT